MGKNPPLRLVYFFNLQDKFDKLWKCYISILDLLLFFCSHENTDNL